MRPRVIQNIVTKWGSDKKKLSNHPTFSLHTGRRNSLIPNTRVRSSRFKNSVALFINRNMANTRNSTMTPSRFQISKYSSGYLSLYFTYTFEKRALFLTWHLSEKSEIWPTTEGQIYAHEEEIIFVNTKPWVTKNSIKL